MSDTSVYEYTCWIPAPLGRALRDRVATYLSCTYARDAWGDNFCNIGITHEVLRFYLVTSCIVCDLFRDLDVELYTARCLGVYNVGGIGGPLLAYHDDYANGIVCLAFDTLMNIDRRPCRVLELYGTREFGTLYGVGDIVHFPYSGTCVLGGNLCFDIDLFNG